MSRNFSPCCLSASLCMGAAVLLICCVACSTTRASRISASSQAEFSSYPKADLSSAEKAVIKALMEDQFKYERRRNKMVVLSELTDDHGLSKTLDQRKVWDSTEAEMFREFKRINEKPFRLTELSSLRIKMHLLSIQDARAIWSAVDDWERFRRRFPLATCHVTISRAAFSADGKTALIYMGSSIDGLAGTGHIYHLHRRFGWWRVAERSVVWIS